MIGQEGEWQTTIGKPNWADPVLQEWLKVAYHQKLRERTQLQGAFAVAQAIGDQRAMEIAYCDAISLDKVLAVLVEFGGKAGITL